MTDDPHPGADRTQAPARSGRVSDGSAARLFAALQTRPGHALVVADDDAAAEAFFARVDAQLVCQRRVRLAGTGLDPEAVILALGADLRGPHRPRSGEAILSMVAAEARAAGLPILVIVTGAEEAGAGALERLWTLIEAVPDARAVVRLVLLGGPRLEGVLAQPEGQKLAARIGTTVRAPSPAARRWVFPVPTPRSLRDSVQWTAAGIVALLGVILLFSPWTRHDGERPTAIDAAPNEAAPNEAAPPTVAPTADAEPAAVGEPAAVPPGPAAVPEPAAVAEPPAVAEPAPALAPAEAVEPPAAAPVPAEAPRSVTTARRHSPLRQSLQVGAFRNPENARALAATLSARFPDVRVVSVRHGGVTFHCVRLGGFSDAGALAARADALRAAGYPSVRAPD